MMQMVASRARLGGWSTFNFPQREKLEMSSESFKKFMEKVRSDEGLKTELRAAGSAAGMPVEAMVAFAAGKGYDFKVEDVSSELTDKQLDAVAGGAYDAFLKIDGLQTFSSPAGKLMIKFW